MSRLKLAAVGGVLLATLLVPQQAFGDVGGGVDPGGSTIATWVVGPFGGGVTPPVGSVCGPWTKFTGPTFEGTGTGATRVNPQTGQTETLYQRSCPPSPNPQYAWVPPFSGRDLANIARAEVTRRLPKPVPTFSPAPDEMIVNYLTLFAVTPAAPVSATASIPGLSSTVTAVPASITLITGSKIPGDAQKVVCKLWGSTTLTTSCSFTPLYPSVTKVTGTRDGLHDATVSITWNVSWRATNGTGGTLDALTTTTPVRLDIWEIQTIGDG